MKKFLIGATVSISLMITGILLNSFYRPTVDMTSLGKYYYSDNRSRIHQVKASDDNIGMKVISGDKTTLKFRLDIKDLKGAINIESIYHYRTDIGKEEMKILKTYNENELNNEEIARKLGKTVHTLKSKEIKYKWVEKPKNLIIVQDKYKDGSVVRDKVMDNGIIPLNGELSIEFRSGLQPESMNIYGEHGSGVLEVELKSIYS